MTSSKGVVMRRRIAFNAVVLSFFSVFGVAVAAAEVRVDFDRHRDFGKYRTISVEIGPLVRADGVVDEQNTLAEDRLRRAVREEFLARGIETTDGRSDLIVRVSARETERNEIFSTGWGGHPGSWRWGYWRRPYGRWGGFYDDVWSRRYVEGSLLIDVIERETGELIYRAQVREEVSRDRDKQVTKVVDKAFKKFPVEEITD
jgi:hypothetical protein